MRSEKSSFFKLNWFRMLRVLLEPLEQQVVEPRLLQQASNHPLQRLKGLFYHLNSMPSRTDVRHL